MSENCNCNIIFSSMFITVGQVVGSSWPTICQSRLVTLVSVQSVSGCAPLGNRNTYALVEWRCNVTILYRHHLTSA